MCMCAFWGFYQKVSIIQEMAKTAGREELDFKESVSVGGLWPSTWWNCCIILMLALSCQRGESWPCVGGFYHSLTCVPLGPMLLTVPRGIADLLGINFSSELMNSGCISSSHDDDDDDDDLKKAWCILETPVLISSVCMKLLWDLDFRNCWYHIDLSDLSDHVWPFILKLWSQGCICML